MEENDPRSWERPWTTEEMRSHSANWTLAGDAGLLKHLQELSQNLLSRTHSTNQKMDSLFEDLRNTTTEVNNVTNKFLSLSNTQFVESRVYEDEDKETPKDESKPLELSKEQKQAEVVSNISEALSLGMSVLDTMFNVVQVSGSDSDDEESISSGVHTILEPKNLYLNRPLPYLIGSKEFMEDDRIGLADPASVTEDNVSLGPTHSSDTEREQAAADQMASSSSGCSDLESDQVDRKEQANSSFAPNNETTDSLFDVPVGENMFGQKSPQDSSSPSLVKRAGHASFAEELAAKLGGVAAQDHHNQAEKKSQPSRAQNKFADAIFSPEDVEDNDSLFEGGKFSTKSGLFDDLDEPTVSAAALSKPMETKTVPVPARGSLFSDDLFNAEPDEDDIFSISKKPTVKLDEHMSVPEKKPVGGVSIFGKDLFGKEVPKHLLRVPEKGSLFSSTPNSEIDDTEGLFSNKTKPNISVQKSSAALFDYVDDNDLFSSNPKTKPNVSTVTEQSSTAKKIHHGGDSIFDDDLFNKSSSKSPLNQPDATHNTASGGIWNEGFTENTSSGLGQTNAVLGSLSVASGEPSFNTVLTSTCQQSEQSQTLRDEPIDSLFQKPKGSLGKSAITSTVISSKTHARKTVSLFDSDSDESDLFSRTSSPSIRSIDKVEQEKRPPLQKKSLFSNDEQLFQARSSDPKFDIFGSTKTGNLSQTKQSIDQEGQTAVKPATKINFLDGDDDEIDIFAPRTTKLADTKKSNLLDFGEDTVDDIFAVTRPKTKSNVKLSDNLFDDVDDLFAVPKSTKSISERLFEDLQSDSVLTEESRSVLKGSDVKMNNPKLEPPTTLNIRKTTDLFADVDVANKNQMEFSEENEKPDLEKILSSTNIVTQKKTEKKTMSLFDDLNDNNTDDIFTKKDTHYQVSDVFSDGGNSNFTSKNVSKKGETEVVKSKEQISEPPLVESQSSFKDGDTKLAAKPEVLPRTSKASTFDTIIDTIRGKPEVVPRKKLISKANEKNLCVNIAQEEASREPSHFTRNKQRQGPQKAASIQERSKLINPSTLLHGGRPPKVVEYEKNVSFEEAVPTTTTLRSAGKERAKIPVKRRPQSRRARQEAIRTSSIFDDESEIPDLIAGEDDGALRKSQSEPLKLESRVGHQLNTLATGESKQDTSPSSSPGGSASGKLNLAKIPSPPSLFSPDTDEGEDLFGIPQDLPEYDHKEDLEGNLFGGAPVLSPLDKHPPSFQSDIPDMVLKNENKVGMQSGNVKTDIQSSKLSKSPNLFENNNDRLFSSISAVDNSNSDVLTNKLKTSMHTGSDDLFSEVTKPENESASLFENDCELLFSSNANSLTKNIHEEIIGAKSLSQDNIFSTSNKEVSKKDVGKDQIKTKNEDNWFSSASVVDNEGIFNTNKKSLYMKNDVDNNLFPTASSNQVFGTDDDSLFKSTNKEDLSKKPVKIAGDEAIESKKDKISRSDLLSTSDSAPDKEHTISNRLETVESISTLGYLYSHPPTSKALSENVKPASLQDLFTSLKPLPPLNENLFSVISKECKPVGMRDNDLFGSLSTQSKVQDSNYSKDGGDDLFSIRASDTVSENTLFGSMKARSHSPISREDDEDLFFEKPVSKYPEANTKVNLFGGNSKSQNPSKTQKSPNLFDDDALAVEDLFSLGSSMMKTGILSTSDTNTATAKIGAIKSKAPVRKSLFDDDDGDDIFSSSLSKASKIVLQKPTNVVQTKVRDEKPEPLKSTSSSLTSTKDKDFEDPLMAFQRD